MFDTGVNQLTPVDGWQIELLSPGVAALRRPPLGEMPQYLRANLVATRPNRRANCHMQIARAATV